MHLLKIRYGGLRIAALVGIRSLFIMPFLGKVDIMTTRPDQTLCDDNLLRDSANEDVSEQSLVLLKSMSCWSKTR